MKRQGGGDAPRGSKFREAVERATRSYEIWKTDFASVGKMRGVGWAIATSIRPTGRISNHWIELHETGNIAGFVPLLVMDVWEHAYLLDYKPADRPKYIEAFLSQRRLGLGGNADEGRHAGGRGPVTFRNLSSIGAVFCPHDDDADRGLRPPQAIPVVFP